MASITLTLSSIRNKSTGKSEVLLRYRNTRAVALRAHTHTFILPKFFADGEIVIKNRIVTPEVREAQEAKVQIDRIVAHLTEQGNKKAVEDFTQNWAQDTIDRLLYPENYTNSADEPIYFLDKTEDFLKHKNVTESRKLGYITVFNIIHRYELYTGKKLPLDEITSETMSDIENFARDEHTFFEPVKKYNRITFRPLPRYKHVWDNTTHYRPPLERSDNALVSYMRAVRAYWHWLMDMEYTKNDPFRKYSPGSQKYGTPYYLTTEERDIIYKTDFKDDIMLALARDMFVFQCYIGCRISDLRALTWDNIVKSDNGLSVQYIPSKTKKESQRVVKVYLAPTAIEIINRHKGEDGNRLFPYMELWRLNPLIRDVLNKAGINRVVTIFNPVTKQSEQHPICDVASSHMARRTFIGNLYKKVKDPNLVGKLSGHVEGSQAFARYRDIDDDMIREMTDLLD